MIKIYQNRKNFFCLFRVEKKGYILRITEKVLRWVRLRARTYYLNILNTTRLYLLLQYYRYFLNLLWCRGIYGGWTYSLWWFGLAPQVTLLYKFLIKYTEFSCCPELLYYIVWSSVGCSELFLLSWVVLNCLFSVSKCFHWFGFCFCSYALFYFSFLSFFG